MHRNFSITIVLLTLSLHLASEFNLLQISSVFNHNNRANPDQAKYRHGVNEVHYLLHNAR